MEKLLLVGTKSYARITGVSIAFDILIEELDKLGFTYEVIDRSIIGEPRTAGSFDISRSLKSTYILFKYVKHVFKFQIVYNILAPSQWGFIRDFLIIWIAYLGKKKIALHLHGGGYLEFYNSQNIFFKLIIKKTLEKSSSLIVLDECLENQFSFIQDYQRKTYVVPNTSPTQPPDLISKNLDNQTYIKLLFLSNFIESKGYLDVLEACKILKERGIPFKCDFCGKFVRTSVDKDAQEIDDLGDTEQERFKRISRKYQVDNFINFHGIVSGAEKDKLLRETSLFLLPSYYPWEGQPISLIEAISFGTPCISTNHKGIPGIVIDNYNGILVNKRTPEEIAESVFLLWNDHSKYEAFSKNSSRLFHEKFSRDAHLKKITSAIYQREIL